MTPKVSVIMSVYNAERYVKESIESILRQTFKDFEFLIINDASTDNTTKILQEYGDARIKVLNNEQNIGLTKSLNKALQIAEGEFLARMDADDISMPQRLEKEAILLDQNTKTGLVGSHYLRIDEAGRVLHEVKPFIKSKNLKMILSKENRFAHGSVMFRRDCIDKVGKYREEFKYSQDYDLWLRIADFSEVANIPEFLYKWRLNERSASVYNKTEQDHFASLAIELAQERKMFGKDRLQLTENDSVEKRNIDYQSGMRTGRKTASDGLNYWGVLLFHKGNYNHSLKWLFKSLIRDPSNLKSCFYLSVVVLHILLPEFITKTIRSFVNHIFIKK